MRVLRAARYTFTQRSPAERERKIRLGRRLILEGVLHQVLSGIANGGIYASVALALVMIYRRRIT